MLKLWTSLLWEQFIEMFLLGGGIIPMGADCLIASQIWGAGAPLDKIEGQF